jgi:hypothetical protein
MLTALAAGATLALNTCREIDIAFDTDVEFVLRRCHGDPLEVRRYVNTLVAQASVITSAQLDVRVRASAIRVRTGPAKNDPWNAPIDEVQREQFRDYWNANEAATERDMAILLSGRELGESQSPRSSIATDEAFGVLVGLTGTLSDDPHSFGEGNADLVAFLRVVAVMAGASPTSECDPEDCPEPMHGSIMSRCDACPGGAGNIELTFAPESIEAIWQLLDRAPKPLGSAEKGLKAMDDVAVILAGETLSVPVLVNDAATNCGVLTLTRADGATSSGWPVSVAPSTDERPTEELTITAPADASGISSVSYFIADNEEATGSAALTLIVRTADLNGDSTVDDADVRLLGERGPTAAEADLDGNGLVDATDLARLLGAVR